MADSLFTELKRRNVFKVGTAYLVLAWIVIQVTGLAVPALHLPDWINTAVFFFGVIGLPFALFFAWAFEITPDGIKKESEINRDESLTSHTGRKLDFSIIALLVIALGYFIYESRYESQSTGSPVVDTVTSEVEAPKALVKPEGSSIAVLPFVNMSSDKEQEYFSDGISEEILNVLAKIPNLHVTSRSSAFFYKNTKINIAEVAAKLGVSNVLEGSVRKSGNRIRITAQLIAAGTDKHLWSETYDRELTDIFAIQDEISAAIVLALKSKLGLDTKVAVRDMSKVNLDAHNEYLKGRFYIENRNKADLEKALAHFNKSVALAPEYAPAWMGKAWAIFYLSEANYGTLPRQISASNAKSAIEMALQLNQNLPETHAILGIIEAASFNWDKAKIHYKKAIELNPNYADVYSWYGQLFEDQPETRLALFKKAVQLSPMSIMANYTYAEELLLYGRIDEVKAIYQDMLTINDSHNFTYAVLGKIRLIEGKYAQAIIAFEEQIKNLSGNVGSRFNAANTLATIGLGEKAASYIDGSIADPIKYWFIGDDELYIREVRAIFPLSGDDARGNWVRAHAEVFAENYKEANKYFELADWNITENARIYSYQQTGDTQKAKPLLEQEKAKMKLWIEEGIKYFDNKNLIQPITLREMEIAVLDGDIDKAIVLLKNAMKKNYIVHNDYLKRTIYQKLRAHPEWPAIIAQSNKRASEQRDLYFKLIAEDKLSSIN